jgi:hypothetical protein
MGMLLSLVFSKLGAILAGSLGVLALWLRGTWHERQAQKARQEAEDWQTAAEIAKNDLKVEQNVQDEKQKVDAASGPDALRTEFDRLRQHAQAKNRED